LVSLVCNSWRPAGKITVTSRPSLSAKIEQVLAALIPGAMLFHRRSQSVFGRINQLVASFVFTKFARHKHSC
jgi:hypothetical protein